MSEASLHSPALRLRIVDSPLGRRAFLYVAALALGIPWQLADRGHTVPALALAPLLTWLCWSLRRLPWCGASLSWRLGQWRLEVEGRELAITLAPGAVVLPWVLLFPFRFDGQGARHYLWLFVDGVEARAWRRLRVRVRLPDPGRGARW